MAKGAAGLEPKVAVLNLESRRIRVLFIIVLFLFSLKRGRSDVGKKEFWPLPYGSICCSATSA